MYKQSGVDADDFGNERYGYLTEGAKKQIAEATGVPMKTEPTAMEHLKDISGDVSQKTAAVAKAAWKQTQAAGEAASKAARSTADAATRTAQEAKEKGVHLAQATARKSGELAAAASGKSRSSGKQTTPSH